MKESSFRLLAIALVVFVAAFFRLVPHAPNAVPMVALALFAGAKLNDRRIAFILVFLSMFVSDLVIGFDATSPFVYLSLGAVVLLGGAVGTKNSPFRILAGTFAGSVLFFGVTNFAVWMMQDLYPRTVAGLLECYVMGLPFFRNGLSADVAYAALFFGCFAYAERRYVSLRPLSQIAAA